MKRWMLLGVAGVGLLLAVGAARRLVRDRVFQLFERMMEDVMPGMMDACFARMPPQRRELMLAHCRGALDRVEAKYVDVTATAVEGAAPEHAEVALSARA